jgi:hypothetical protein
LNLVGHVAAALDPAHADPSETTGATRSARSVPPSTEFLVGCMLPDLAAIARVRITRPGGELGAGVAFHHACDAAFHDSVWFNETNRDARDALVAAGVASGPARACSHAGVEMLLDGELVSAPVVLERTHEALDAVASGAPELAGLAPPESREAWVERLEAIGTYLDPARYRDMRFVAERLCRMTSGRRRIELPVDQVDVVATTLASLQRGITAAAPGVLAGVREQVSRTSPASMRERPIPHRRG